MEGPPGQDAEWKTPDANDYTASARASAHLETKQIQGFLGLEEAAGFDCKQARGTPEGRGLWMSCAALRAH